MPDQNQNNNDFPEGFLIRDKSGQFKKVQDDHIVDFKPKLKPEPLIKPPEPLVKGPVALGTRPVRPTTPAVPLGPQPPISSSDKAVSFMEPEDEVEIKRHAEELKKLVEKPSFDLGVTLNSIIEKIIHQHDLHFADEVMLKRFSKVIESRLRDIREPIETKEVLTRSTKIGGLELPADLVEKIMTTVEAEVDSLHKAGLAKKEPEKEVIEEKIPRVIPYEEKKEKEMFAPAPPPFIPRPKPREKIEEKPVVKLPLEEEKPEKLAEEIKEELEVAKRKEEKILEEPVSPVEPAPTTPHELYRQPQEAMPRRVRVEQPVAERPWLADIKQPVKVVGPVEELVEIDLKEFRRQGANPQEAIEKILEKIELLEEDSWQSKMDGVKAWKKSATNQLYLDIGRESIESGATVEEVIRKRMQEGKPHLLMEEFLAINNLNSQLAI